MKKQKKNGIVKSKMSKDKFVTSRKVTDEFYTALYNDKSPAVVGIKGSYYLLNLSKFKSGPRKGQYKYIEMRSLKW